MARRGKVIPEEIWQGMPALPEPWLNQLQAELAWSPEITERLDLRLWKGLSGENRVAIPIRDRTGRLTNIRLLKPLVDEHEIVNFRMGQGDNEVYFGGLHLWPHPQSWPWYDFQTCWVVSCEAEAITGLSQGLFAVCATGPPGAWKAAFSRRFQKFLKVVVCFPHDLRSQEQAMVVAKSLRQTQGSVEVLRWCDTFAHEAPRESGWGLAQYFTQAGGNVGLLEALRQDCAEVVWQAPQGEQTVPPEQSAGLAHLKAFSSLDEQTTFRPILLAREILSQEQIVTDQTSGVTYRYDGQVWRVQTQPELRALIMQRLDLASGRNRINEALEMILALSVLPQDQAMDPDPRLLCVANGMLDLDTWQLLPHDPLHLATYQFPWPFDPHNPPDCPGWKRYLVGTVPDPAVRAELQHFTGYCLWRRYPWHKALFLVGDGNNGKGVFLDVLKWLVGDKRCTSLNLKDLEDQFLRASLRDAWVNIFMEASADFFSTAYFKALSGGDPITAAYKFQAPFEFRSRCKLAFSCNELPEVRDKSFGYYRRILPVRFSRTFNQADEDPFLRDKLGHELPGIFHWALVGLHRLRKASGFCHCQATQEELSRYQHESDPIRWFVDDQCQVRPDSLTDKGILYKAYRTWAKDFSLRSIAQPNRFFVGLKRAVPGINLEARPGGPGPRPRMVSGLCLRDASSLEGL